SPLAPGGWAVATVTVSAPGLLDAWIDFDRDGHFDRFDGFDDDPREQIAVRVRVVEGPNRLVFSIPADAPEGRTYARFRLSTSGTESPSGPALDGEVEDYALQITRPQYVVVDQSWRGDRVAVGDVPPHPGLGFGDGQAVTAFGYDAFVDLDEHPVAA